MVEIETMSHVALLDAYDANHDGFDGEAERIVVRAEILRRMDSACTSRREEIEPERA